MANPTNSSAFGAALAELLAEVAPFSGLEAVAREFLVARLVAISFPAGAEVFAPVSGVPGSLVLIGQGSVRRRPLAELPETLLGRGDFFPVAALLAGEAVDAVYIAAENCTGWRLAADDFPALLAIAPTLPVAIARQVASQLGAARQALLTLSARRDGELRSLHTPLTDIGARRPLALEADQPLTEALEKMSAARVGSLAVVDRDRRPIGIFTRHDLLDRVILAHPGAKATLGDVMTVRPRTLPEKATAGDAAVAMAVHAIRHLLVVDEDGRLTGVVSERDLVALQRSSPWHVRQTIAASADIDALERVAADVRRLSRGLLGQGLGPTQMTAFISALNDALTRRVIELALEKHDLFGIDWCWLAFGSEGRDEQTFVTDQDNGIVFVCNDFSDRDELKLRLVDFARTVNDDLDRCGFPLCAGNIMAGNPAWCLTVEEWQAQYAMWVQSPEPAALLNATIFFDFRPLFGKAELAGRLSRHLLGLTTTTPLFLRAMAQNALDVEPPLGTFRDFRTDLEPGHPGAIDLKKYGARLFVDAARIIALAAGVRATNTAERLRQAASLAGARGDDIEASIEAFDFIQGLRLSHQPESVQGQNANLIVPETLNELDRRILKEAFKQAKKLQTRLKLDYLAR